MSPAEPASTAPGVAPTPDVSPGPIALAGLPPPPARSTRALDGGERLLSGWGRTAPSRARLLRPRTAEEVAEALAASPRARGGAIARGAGRSYGDAAQNGGGTVLDATGLCGPLQLDATGLCGPLQLDATGLCGPLQLDAAHARLRVGAGRTLAEVLAHLAAHGLTLPVVPGTRHLTVGGALAADVHGKNHLRDGSFGAHVESLVLCTPADGPRLLDAEHDGDLFDATLGGMGLTGVVCEAVLALTPLRSATAVADVRRLDTLEQALAGLVAAPHRYAIAWVDLLSGGAAFGRSVLTLSEEGPGDGLVGGTGLAGEAGPVGRAELGGEAGPAGPGPTEPEPARARRWGRSVHRRGAAGATHRVRPPFAPRPRLTVPRRFPGGLLRPAAVRAFNAAHWRAAPRDGHGRRLSMGAQLFPLDALGEWSRLYGPQGLVQYQFVVPRGAEETLLRAVRLLRARRQPMYLAVLKRFGPARGGPLSFPLEGLTLAVDLPAAAEGLHRALDEADELVASAGGRVYLAKDSRLRAATLAAMYPGLERLRELRERVDPDGVLRSDMGRRLGLCG
jgi:decaprenylphospho-beta-D-ribofuranose 2-oxidase